MDLKTYLQEVALKEMSALLKEEQGRFSLKTLESIKKPQGVFEYLQRVFGNTPHGGQGRITYLIDSKTVIKFAYDGGFEQNKAEMENAECLGTAYAARILHHHPEFWWLIAERVDIFGGPEPFNQALYKVLGIKMNGVFAFPDAIQSEIHEKVSNEAEALNNEMKKNPWYMELVTRLKGCNVSARDFHYANWGIRPSTGELVLLDLGF